MTAIGFLLWIVCICILKMETEFFWNHYKKAHDLLTLIAGVGFLLLCVGIAIVFWRHLP